MVVNRVESSWLNLARMRASQRYGIWLKDHVSVDCIDSHFQLRGEPYSIGCVACTSSVSPIFTGAGIQADIVECDPSERSRPIVQERSYIVFMLH